MKDPQRVGLVEVPKAILDSKSKYTKWHDLKGSSGKKVGGRGAQNVWPGDQTVWRCLPKSRCVRPAICQISAVQVKHWKGQRTLFFRAIIVPGLRSHEFFPRDICVI